MSTAQILLLMLVIASACYYVACAEAAWRYDRRRALPPTKAGFPPVSILRPIHGMDAEALQNHASFCQQDYPEWEIIFGSLNPQDPGLDAAESTMRAYPGLPITIVRGGEADAINRKVANLQNMIAHARHSILVLSDSDIRVGPDYLRRIIAPFDDPRVGVVTCPYRGSGAQGLGALLESLWIGAGFIPGLLVTWRWGTMDFAMGSTIAIRRDVLEGIGGLRVLSDYLADDFQIGNRAAELGYRVILSDYVVDSIHSREPLAATLARQIRWARTTRICRRWGHCGLFITHGVALAGLMLASSGFSPSGWIILGLISLIQMASLTFCGWKALMDMAIVRRFWLLPLWDLIGFGIWFVSLFGDTVIWRGRRYRLLRDGRILPVASLGQDMPESEPQSPQGAP